MSMPPKPTSQPTSPAAPHVQLPTLRQLTYVLAVADLGHFGQAARRCAVSQPALSRQVKEVEALLGVVLFERARPRVLVTEAGQAVVAQARRVLVEAEGLRHVVAGQRSQLGGDLTLGVIPTIAPYLLPTLLGDVSRSWPELRLRLLEDKTEVLVDRLRRGELDVAVLALPVAGEDLTEEVLFEEPFVLAAPHGHPLALPQPARAAELRGHRLLLMDEGHCFRDHALDVCHATGADGDPAIVATSLTTLMMMVQGGLGATLLPASALTALPGGEGMVLRSFVAEGAQPTPSRAIGLRWRPTSPRAAAFRRLGARMVAHVTRLGQQMPAGVFGGAPGFRVVGETAENLDPLSR